jgi:hypothetical protein
MTHMKPLLLAISLALPVLTPLTAFSAPTVPADRATTSIVQGRDHRTASGIERKGEKPRKHKARTGHHKKAG